MKTTMSLAISAIVLLTLSACNFAASPNECLEAAQEARMPDRFIRMLEEPGNLNALERTALRTALESAGLDDVCGKALKKMAQGEEEKPSREEETRKKQERREARRDNQQGELARPTGLGGNQYADCLDEVYLRASDEHEPTHWLPGTAWYCSDIAPTPLETPAYRRCQLDEVAGTRIRYPEWNELLHSWQAIAQCAPPPSAASEHLNQAGPLPTPYATCMDNVYLDNRKMIGNDEVAVGISAWLCRDFTPEPPERNRQRCYLNEAQETREIFPDWPERMHGWHAIMQCLPDWKPAETMYSRSETYERCLEDIYLTIRDNYPKDHAIPAAVWKCRPEMPNPPEVYRPRCEINLRKRAEESALEIPGELHRWNSIVQCYPKATG